MKQKTRHIFRMGSLSFLYLQSVRRNKFRVFQVNQRTLKQCSSICCVRVAPTSNILKAIVIISLLVETYKTENVVL
jgi:hypothetical protein